MIDNRPFATPRCLFASLLLNAYVMSLLVPPCRTPPTDPYQPPTANPQPHDHTSTHTTHITHTPPPHTNTYGTPPPHTAHHLHRRYISVSRKRRRTDPPRTDQTDEIESLRAAPNGTPCPLGPQRRCTSILVPLLVSPTMFRPVRFSSVICIMRFSYFSVPPFGVMYLGTPFQL